MNASTAPSEAGRQFAETLATKQWDELAALLDPQLDFRAMTPRRFWEAATPAEVVDDVLTVWFGAGDHIEGLEEVQVGTVADRCSVRYQLRVRNNDGVHLVEQQGYYDVGEDGRIVKLHMMCAGYRPRPDQ